MSKSHKPQRPLHTRPPRPEEPPTPQAETAEPVNEFFVQQAGQGLLIREGYRTYDDGQRVHFAQQESRSLLNIRTGRRRKVVITRNFGETIPAENVHTTHDAAREHAKKLKVAMDEAAKQQEQDDKVDEEIDAADRPAPQARPQAQKLKGVIRNRRRA